MSSGGAVPGWGWRTRRPSPRRTALGNADPAAGRLAIGVLTGLPLATGAALPVTGAVRPVVRPATSGVALPAVRPVTSADPAGVQAAHRPAISIAPVVTIGDHRSVLRTTTGADVSTAPRGATDCRRGAGARRLRRFGTGRCPRHGARRRRRSTTSVSTSNRCGIPATTSGVSISSGSGFRYRSDRPSGETAASDNSRGGRQRFSAANSGSAGA